MLVRKCLSPVDSAGAGHEPDRQQASRDVNALLAGIPQKGTTLGSPQAPITLRVFADLECRDVQQFALSGLRSIIDTWVRKGVIKLDYRSLETDTRSRETFAIQEIAALAAGRQDKLWNFALAFVYQQGKQFTGYVTEKFLTDIASQVPGLDWELWQHDRADGQLFAHVARSDHSARTQGLSATPTFLIGPTDGEIDLAIGNPNVPGVAIDATSLAGYVESLS